MPPASMDMFWHLHCEKDFSVMELSVLYTYVSLTVALDKNTLSYARIHLYIAQDRAHILTWCIILADHTFQV